MKRILNTIKTLAMIAFIPTGWRNIEEYQPSDEDLDALYSDMVLTEASPSNPTPLPTEPSAPWMLQLDAYSLLTADVHDDQGDKA